jgi:hypothetical protein
LFAAAASCLSLLAFFAAHAPVVIAVVILHVRRKQRLRFPARREIQTDREGV